MDYSIGQLAKQAGYAVQTVRYYEETGLMPHPPRTEGGNAAIVPSMSTGCSSSATPATADSRSRTFAA
jgi:hypothetical protein